MNNKLPSLKFKIRESVFSSESDEIFDKMQVTFEQKISNFTSLLANSPTTKKILYGSVISAGIILILAIIGLGKN